MDSGCGHKEVIYLNQAFQGAVSVRAETQEKAFPFNNTESLWDHGIIMI